MLSSKKVCFILLLLGFGLTLMAQNSKVQKTNQLDSLIQKSLELYVKERVEYAKTHTGGKEWLKKGIVNIIVNDFPLRFTFQDSIAGLKVHKINLNDKATKKKMRKTGGVGGTELRNVHLNGNQLEIVFGDGWIHTKKGDKTLYVTYPMGGSFIYKLDCEKQKWLLFDFNINR